MFSFQSALRDRATNCTEFLLSDLLVMVDQQELQGGKGPSNLFFLGVFFSQLRDILLQSQLRYTVDKYTRFLHCTSTESTVAMKGETKPGRDDEPQHSWLCKLFCV